MTDIDTRPRALLELRQAPEFEVRWADRTIEMVAMPYDREAPVVVHGRDVIESCAPGAFGQVGRRAGRVPVNRDHDPYRTVGKVVALHPSRTEGLVAEVRIADSTAAWSLPDETLALASSKILEPSVGFMVMSGGEQWSADRSRRRLTRLFLDHLSLVPEGAYGESEAEGARVLAVRQAGAGDEPPARVPTPLLDAVRLELAQDAMRHV